VRTRLAQSADVSAQIAREPNLDLVLAVLDECMGHRRPAARAQRQAGQMICLREVGGQANDIALERRLSAPNRQAADFLRGRNVAVQECRRQVAVQGGRAVASRAATGRWWLAPPAAAPKPLSLPP